MSHESEERVSLHNPVLFSRDSELDAQLRISEEAVHVEAPTGGSPTTSSVVTNPLPYLPPSSPAASSPPPPPAPAPPATPPRPAYESIITQTDRHGTPTAPPRAATSTPPRSPGASAEATSGNNSDSSSSRDGKMLQSPNSGGNSSSSPDEKRSCCWCLFWCCDGEDELSDEWKNNDRESELPARNKTPRKPDRYRTVKLLSSPLPRNVGRKCLVLDLDETLVHSSFQAIPNPDYIIPVTINNIVYSVYVLKRPGVDEFLRRMGEVFEIVLFTASLSKYADPLLNELDTGKVIDYRLFREHCVLHDGHYVKDLSLLNRDISQTIIVDNSPLSYFFQPDNAIDCFSYIDDPTDVELWEIADFLESIKDVKDVRFYCKTWKEWCKNNPNSSVPKNKRVSSTTSI